MNGIRPRDLLVMLTAALALSGCGFTEAFKTPEPWKLGVMLDGAPDAQCVAKVGKFTGEGRAPGNIDVQRWVPDPIPPKTKFDPPKYLPLVVTCTREGYHAAELTLRETLQGWTITGIKYWPGHAPTAGVGRYQRSPTAITVPMAPIR